MKKYWVILPRCISLTLSIHRGLLCLILLFCVLTLTAVRMFWKILDTLLTKVLIGKYTMGFFQVGNKVIPANWITDWFSRAIRVSTVIFEIWKYWELKQKKYSILSGAWNGPHFQGLLEYYFCCIYLNVLCAQPRFS